MNVLEDIRAYMDANPEVLKVKSTFQYTVDDQIVSVDTTDKAKERIRAGKFKQGPDDPGADVEVTMSMQHYLQLREGRSAIELQMAFYEGKIIIKGTQPKFLEFWRLFL
jgi:hypothetical protein